MQTAFASTPATRTEAAAPAARMGSPRLPAWIDRHVQDVFTPRWSGVWGGKFITHGRTPQADAVRLDGNDYLAVTGHPAIVQAQIDTLRTNHEFVVQSGVFLKDEAPGPSFERELAHWIGMPAGMLCQSGYAANTGLLQAVARPEAPVYIDSMAHMSIWEGIKAAGAQAHAFRHNDPEHLLRLIERHGPGLIAVDSVYSTTGAVCPLARIVEVSEATGSMLLVDESHSLGTHGPQGRGLCAELGLTGRVHFITASLAKAFAGRAGFIALPAELKYYVMSYSHPSIFSSCLLPHDVAGLAATLRVIQGADDARRRLHANTARLRQSLADAGYPVHQGSEQIIALEAGEETRTLALRDALEARGVFGAVFAAPATSQNRTMVRLTLNAALTDADMSHVEDVAAAVAPQLKPWDWPVARRLRARQAS